MPQHVESGGASRILEDFSERFSPAIRGVVEYAKRIPGFAMLSQDDQVTLLKVRVAHFAITSAHIRLPVLNTFPCLSLRRMTGRRVRSALGAPRLHVRLAVQLDDLPQRARAAARVAALGEQRTLPARLDVRLCRAHERPGPVRQRDRTVLRRRRHRTR